MPQARSAHQTGEGIWYPIGRTRAVPLALEKLAIELGVEIRTRTHITQILTPGSVGLPLANIPHSRAGTPRTARPV